MDEVHKKQIYQLANIGHWELDVLNNELHWSDQQKRLHDVALDYNPSIEEALSFFKEGEHRSYVRKAVTKAIEKGEAFTVEVQIVTADGNLKWVKALGEPEIEDGRCVRVLGCTKDITDQRKAQKQTQETKQELSDIIEHSTIMFYRHDTNHKLTYVSPQSEQFLGCSPEQAKQEWTNFITDHPKNKEGLKNTEKAIQTGEPQEPYELQLKRKDGKKIWVRVNESPVVENRETKEIIGSLTNITDLKEQQDELNKLSRVARETNNLVIITDPDEKIEWVNKAFTKITGYKKEEVIGKNPGNVLQGPDTDPETVARIARKVQSQQPFSEAIRNYTKDGRPYWIKMDVTPITNDEGKLIQYFSIQEDITEQVEKEQQLKRQRDRLAEAQKIGNIGDWFYDVETEKITWSSMMFSIMELDPQKGEPSYRELLEVYSPDKSILSAKVKRAINENVPYRYDTWMETKNGNKKYVHVEGIPKTNANGKVKRIHGIVQDITERRKAQQELKEKEAQLRNIANNIDGMVHRYRLYPDGSDEFVFVSEGVKDLHEVTPQQVMESSDLLWSQIVDDHLEMVRQSVHQSAEQLTPWDNKWKIETPSGQQKWVHGRGTPQKLKDGTVQWDTILLDVTKQKELEQNVSRQVSLLNHILDSIPGLFYMVGEDLTFARTNTNVEQLFDLTSDELQQINALTLIAPRERPKAKRLIGKAFEKGYAELETVLIDGNEKEHHYYMNGSRITLDGNQYVIGNGIDITDRVEAEQENTILLQEVHHRVKNNLAIISGILRLELDDISDESYSRFPLERSINRIHSIAKVHELLYQTSSFSQVSVNKYISDLISTITGTLQVTDQVTIDINVAEIEMNINEIIPLGMLLNELLTNSLKYAFVGKKDGRINLTVTQSDDNGYDVYYSDNGKGFDRSAFENSETLGLTIVNMLLKQLEAEYEVNTEGGFTISFTFSKKVTGSHSNM